MRKLQLNLNEDSWKLLEGVVKEANEDYVSGTITLSDVANEMILNAKVDIRALQAKHANVRKILRLLATQKDIDIESAIRQLAEQKSKGAKARSGKSQGSFDGVDT